MGMAPAASEVSSGEPFVGTAGLLLGRALRLGGLSKESFGLCNTIQCRPPSDDPDAYPAAIRHCKVHRDAAVAHFRPSAIVALGNTPLAALTGEEGVLRKRGYMFRSDEYDLPVVSTYHPSFLGYTQAMQLLPVQLWDIKSALHRGPRIEPALILNPNPQYLQAYVEVALEKATFCVVDIETLYSKHKAEDELVNDPSHIITRMSLSTRLGEGITFPWVEPFISIVRPLLASPIPKWFWNFYYDCTRLRLAGIEVRGEIVDGMWLFKMLRSDLRKGLGFVTPFYANLPEWKSKTQGSEEYYSAMDAVATAYNIVGINKDLAERGVFEHAHNMTTRLLPVLWKMEDRGLLIDKAQAEVAKGELQKELDTIADRLTPLVPEEVRQWHPKNGYVHEPEDTSGMVQRTIRADVKIDHTCVTRVLVGKKGQKLKNPKRLKEECAEPLCKNGSITVARNVTRWFLPLPFLPESPKQVIAYMKAKGHRVPRIRRGGETTEEKYLLPLAAKDPFYKDVIEYRGVNTIKAHLDFPTHADGRVHPHLSLNTATGRLACEAPNFQNIPNDEVYGPIVRRCILASPGHRFVRRDYTGIEAVLQGYFAGDLDYMWLALRGIHAFSTAKRLGITLPSKESPDFVPALSRIKKAHKDIYSKIKKVGHGMNYGESEKGVWENNPGAFSSPSEVRDFYRFIKGLYPRVFAFQDEVVARAKRDHFIDTPYGTRRWFYDIPGKDVTRAKAQLGQGTAADIIKEAMLLLDRTWAGQYLVLQIHDELVLDVPEEEAKEADVVLCAVMERPLEKLGGLVIGTSGAMGRTLAD